LRRQRDAGDAPRSGQLWRDRSRVSRPGHAAARRPGARGPRTPGRPSALVALRTDALCGSGFRDSCRSPRGADRCELRRSCHRGVPASLSSQASLPRCRRNHRSRGLDPGRDRLVRSLRAGARQDRSGERAGRHAQGVVPGGRRLRRGQGSRSGGAGGPGADHRASDHRGSGQHGRHPAGRCGADQPRRPSHHRHPRRAGMTHATVAPITLTVVWNSLISIADELGVTLRHTAFSEGVREGDDFSTAVFDADAVMIAQGNFSPGHLGSMPAVAKTVLQYFPRETLRPGDSILVNDSFIGAGHFPDTYEIMPVFLDGRVIGFVACSAHQVDMGGAAPGSQKVHGVTEAFQEGLRILPVRFVREGRIDEDILRLVLGNVRMPDKVRGDLLAQHAANLSASVRLAAMFRDLGTETVERAYAVILAQSEQTMREALAKVPAGTYSFEDRMDDYGPGTQPIHMAVDITFDGKGEVEFDFSRSSDT